MQQDIKEGDANAESLNLLIAVEKEKELNAAVVTETSGSAVKYGTAIHLQYPKTGLMIGTQAKMIAEQERSCSPILLLQKYISSGCFFKVENRCFGLSSSPSLCSSKVRYQVHILRGWHCTKD